MLTSTMRVADFDFDLPDGQIAQAPHPRGASRLLVVDRASGTWEERTFRDLPSCLTPGDLVVANDTRVFAARLIGRRDPSGGRVECFLLERETESDWAALVHPGQKLQPGARFVIEDPERAPGIRIDGEILARRFFGRRLVRLEAHGAKVDTAPENMPDRAPDQAPDRALDTALAPGEALEKAIDALGHMPLPPYIARPDTADDRERYQTVFARDRGSVAAPTAGLHFDTALINAVRARGVSWATVTLHVGYGTFKPVRTELVDDHVVDAERYVIPPETVDAIRATRSAGGRVIAVGTTTTRALESAALAGSLQGGPGTAELFIRPGHQFEIVGGLLTNFHLPRSSLLMLVAAFAGRDLTLAAYRHAVAAGFRFYSYGDAMLIL